MPQRFFHLLSQSTSKYVICLFMPFWVMGSGRKKALYILVQLCNILLFSNNLNLNVLHLADHGKETNQMQRKEWGQKSKIWPIKKEWLLRKVTERNMKGYYTKKTTTYSLSTQSTGHGEKQLSHGET